MNGINRPVYNYFNHADLLGIIQQIVDDPKKIDALLNGQIRTTNWYAPRDILNSVLCIPRDGGSNAKLLSEIITYEQEQSSRSHLQILESALDIARATYQYVGMVSAYRAQAPKPFFGKKKSSTFTKRINPRVDDGNNILEFMNGYIESLRGSALSGSLSQEWFDAAEQMVREAESCSAAINAMSEAETTQAVTAVHSAQLSGEVPIGLVFNADKADPGNNILGFDDIETIGPDQFTGVTRLLQIAMEKHTYQRLNLIVSHVRIVVAAHSLGEESATKEVLDAAEKSMVFLRDSLATTREHVFASDATAKALGGIRCYTDFGGQVTELPSRGGVKERPVPFSPIPV